MKILFFGTSDFATPSLRILAENFNISLVVSQPPRPAGRGKKLKVSEVELLAKELNLPLATPEKLDTNFIQQIKSIFPDIVVVVDYGKIIPLELLDIPKLGALNIHPSLLPKYRGASPIQSAILAGDNETGVTIMLMDEEIDHGSILMQEKVEIKKSDISSSLRKKCSELGARLLLKALFAYLDNKIKPIIQNDKLATFTKIIKKEDGKINWQKFAKEINNMVRAYSPWPGAYTIWQGKQLKILSTEISVDKSIKNSIGAFFKTKNGQLAAMCKDKALILKKVQLEGKKPITGEEFMRGYFKN